MQETEATMITSRRASSAAVAVPLGELAGALSAAEGLVELVVATRPKADVRLLALTERRLYWSARSASALRPERVLNALYR